MKINSLKGIVARLNYYGINFLDNLLLHGGKLAGRIIFPFDLIIHYGNYVNQQTYYPETELKNKFRIFFEQLFFILRTGEINKDYFLFGFDRKSKNDFREYVTWFTFTHARNKKNRGHDQMNYDPYNYICLLRDKVLFESFCKKVGINTPSNIGFISEGELYLIEKNAFVPLETIQTIEMDAFCKRNASYGGGMKQDVFMLSVSGGVLYINNFQSTFEALKLKLKQNTWVIQERIKNQAPVLAKFHPQSINTLRIVTVKTASSIDILYSSIRMGIDNAFNDNYSSGGISVVIDSVSGTLFKWGIFKTGGGGKRCDRHPNSDIVFEGYIIPGWNEIVEYIKKAHRLFYGFHSIGWDICLTDEGIMVIEGNDNWDTTGAQIYSGARAIYEKYFR
jgi:hypothetical protein